MKILVVNDDSIHAPGLALLAEKAMALGEVWVVAPAHQCSAMSQRLSIRTALRVEKVDFPVPVRGAYQVNGTPVDCVKTALQYILPERPDFVFSGINAGYNVGFDIAYSGTLGAAFEAVMNGIRAIAFSSTMGKPLDVAREYLEPIARELMDRELLPGEVWNVNFPSVEPGSLKGILYNRTIAPMQFYSENYEAQTQPDGSVVLMGRGVPLGEDASAPEGSDVKAVLDGYIAVGKVKSAVM